MRAVVVFTIALAAAATARAQGPAAAMPGQAPQAAYTAPKNEQIPPADPYVADALKNSPRHGEWVDVKAPTGPIKSWVVYPNAPGKMGVVVVIHEIFGMTDWVRGVADQVAKEGFIAIAPDLLSGLGPNGGATDSVPSSQVGALIRTLTPPDRAGRLQAVVAYGKTLSASNGKTGSVGFCWGGDTSFFLATAEPTLNAAVVYYGQIPQLPNPTPGTVSVDEAQVMKLRAPVRGFYGGNDARVDQTIEPAKAAMSKLGKSYEPHVYDGANHGFMHQRSEADYKAAEQSWPLVVALFKEQLK
jgi:carboxymethylenebutenolidase